MSGARWNRRAEALLLLALCATTVQAQPLGGGGPVRLDPPDGCIPPGQRLFARGLLDQYEAKFGPLSEPSANRAPQLLSFFPLAGRPTRDLFRFNYVDLDPGAGFHEWGCTQYTYDGHAGHDTDIRSFAEQVIGVPVFSALSGVVVATHDGEDDRNIVWAGQPANFVIIDHGDGREGWYWHLRKDSVIVALGESVAAGQQIGHCASSGVSTGPHLHFEMRVNGEVYEPYAGPCHSGASGWLNQIPFNREAYLHDFGITYQNISASWPVRWPNSGQIALSDPVIRVWFFGTALPANSTWTVKFIRPDGSSVFGGNAQYFGNPFWSWFNWWWTYDVADMHTITGTWHVQLYINGELMIEAPVEVRTTRTADFNRPPEPISVAFLPSGIREGEVPTCVVETSLTFDDFDYDLVRYEYVWTVNGEEARRVISAAHGDVLATDLFRSGDLLECSVTPSDGILTGQGDVISAVVGAPRIPTLSDWGVVVMALLLATVGVALVRRVRLPHWPST